ncbi:MAG: CDP-alcohol phosphatidyltransferase family protein [Chloroflexota bacterium]|nr:MAG: CDP-alcohol phosphatidyltransferase family protein [Chloroflexota bacterium]
MLTDMARARARDFLNAVARFFQRLGLTPNTLTLIGFAFVCIIAFVIAMGYEALGAILLIVGAGFDATDGSLARLTNRVTKFGGFLDSSLDRYADGVLMLALVWRGIEYNNRWMIVLAVIALIGSFLVSYTRARAEGVGVQLKEGWFTRLERMIVLILGLLSTLMFGQVGLLIALGILALLSNVTAVQRILVARQKLGEPS